MFRCKRLEVGGGFFFICSLFLLVGTPQTLFAVLSAAAIHECAHLFALRLFAARVLRVRITAFGAQIVCDTRDMTYLRELICALAGIAANFLCAVLLAHMASYCSWEGGYLYAGAHLVLAAFNLLPVQPLDGGRALYLLCCCFWESVTAARICAAVGVIVGAAGVLFGAWLAFWAHGGCFLLISALSIFLPQLRSWGKGKLRRGV